MISEENKKVLDKRFSSLVWRIGGMFTAYVLAFILKNVGLLEIPEVYKVVIGLVISEATKYYNINLPKLQGRK